jgi:hypothetical protein
VPAPKGQPCEGVFFCGNRLLFIGLGRILAVR